MAKVCNNCKKELADDDVFCTNCGAKVDEKSDKTSTPSTEVKTNTSNNKGSNNLALIGFIVSIASTLLCCGLFNIVSLALSIVGLIQAKDYNGDGKSFAIAGIAVSAVPIVLWILFYMFSMVMRVVW